MGSVFLFSLSRKERKGKNQTSSELKPIYRMCLFLPLLLFLAPFFFFASLLLDDLRAMGLCLSHLGCINKIP